MNKEKFLKINSKKPSHSYLFIGDYEQSKEYIQDLIIQLKISKFDVYNLLSNESIKIEDIRNLQHQAQLKPYESKYKIIIIDKAEQLTSESANALLKTLEEPPIKSIIILCALNEKNILKTIVSRCRIIKMPKRSYYNLSPDDNNQILNIMNMDDYERIIEAGNLSKKINVENFYEKLITYLELRAKKDKTYYK